MARILVVDDESNLLHSFDLLLTRRSHQVLTAENYDQAAQLFEGGQIDLVITDIVLGGESGLGLLAKVRAMDDSVPVIMMTGQPSIDSASEAVRLGAHEYLRKPVDRDKLYRVVDAALAYKALTDKKDFLERENAAMRARLEAIFNSVSEGLLTMDRDRRLMEINRAAMRFLNLEDDAEGADVLSLFPDEAAKVLGHHIPAALSEGMGFFEQRIQCGECEENGLVMAVAGAPLLDGLGEFSGLVLTLRDITRVERLEQRLRASRRYPGMVGESPAMSEVYELIDDLVDTDTTVLITGESGTGKELVAEALHLGGSRRSGPLVKVNCSALSENVLESELFGHVRGAFTGAVSDREGRFQMAEGGILFLDEIGDISPSVQLKLLRVLQDKEFERVGDNRPIRVDVRVVAATNRDLADLVARGVFRQDLYYRLKVVEITMPPLRNRAGDVMLLADHFRATFNRKLGKTIRGFTREARQVLEHHAWPGNVRELLHAVEHACVRCRGELIGVDHLPRDVRGQALPPTTEAVPNDLEQVLALCGGNKSMAARMLGVSRPTLYRRMREAGLS